MAVAPAPQPFQLKFIEDGPTLHAIGFVYLDRLDVSLAEARQIALREFHGRKDLQSMYDHGFMFLFNGVPVSPKQENELTIEGFMPSVTVRINKPPDSSSSSSSSSSSGRDVGAMAPSPSSSLSAALKSDYANTHDSSRKASTLQFSDGDDGADSEPLLKIVATGGGSCVTLNSLDALTAHRKRMAAGGFSLWLDVLEANEPALHDLAVSYNFHPVTVADIQAGNVREKVEVFPDYSLIVMHAVTNNWHLEKKNKIINKHDRAVPPVKHTMVDKMKSLGGKVKFGKDKAEQEAAKERARMQELMLNSDKDNDNDKTDHPPVLPMKMVIMSDCVLTICLSHGATPLLDEARQALQADTQILNLTARAPNRILIVYRCLTGIINVFEPLVHNAVSEVERLDDEIYAFEQVTAENNPLERLGIAHRQLTHLIHFLRAKSKVMTTITHPSFVGLQGMRPAYLRDVKDTVMELANYCNIAEEMIKSLENVHMAHVSLLVAEQSNKMNLEMKKFSSIATILLPLTLLAGMFGMNVTVPGQEYSAEHTGWDALMPFFSISAIFVVMAVWLLVYFRRHDLI